MHLTLISFNILDLPTFSEEERQRRLGEIAVYLRGLDPDIVCLQEAWNIEHRDLLHTALGADRYHRTNGHLRRALFFIHLDTTGGLVIFSKFPITRNVFVPFKRMWNAALPEFFSRKGFLDVVLQTPRGPLRVVNTHLHQPAYFGDAFMRRKQFASLLAHLDAADEALPAIVAGDFNAHHIAAHEDFIEPMRAARLAQPASDGALAPSFRPDNPFANRLADRLTNSKIEGPKRYDHILMRHLDRAGLSVARYEPLPLNPPLSDHDPVILTLTSS